MADGLLSSFRELILIVVEPLIRYRTTYSGKVVAQRGDGSLDVRLDSPLIPGMTHIPPRYGVPGATAKVPNGTRCVVAFVNASPKTPIVLAWETGTITELALGDGTARVIREGDTLQISGAVVPGGSGSVTGSVVVTTGQIPPGGLLPEKSKLKA